MKQIIYICICVLYGFITGLTAYAQKAVVPDAGKIGNSVPDTALAKAYGRYSIWGNYFSESIERTPFETKTLPATYFELQQSYPQDKGQTQGISSLAPRAINSSLSVGTTTGVAEVTVSGAASYRIPIEVPQGIAGLAPAISINYNSQAGIGLMGYGWGLTAFSTVSRGGKTFYHDAAAEAPQLTNADNLVLDGQRLMLVSGQSLTNGARYRMENDPTTDIVYKTVGSYYGFVVRTKDGMIKEFGSTANSNIEAPGGSTLFWLLSKVTDKNGNTITYQYEEVVNNGEFYLTKILYAGNRSIDFSYETRSDKQKGYYAGAVVNSNKIVKSISTYIGQTRVKYYQFNYTYDGFYSKLTEIIENGQSDQRYNSTLVNYGSQGTTGGEELSGLSVNREGNKPLFADFNGDGRMDFLSYPEKSSYTSTDVATLFIATETYGGTSFVKKTTIPMVVSSGQYLGFMLADLNGDGKMDVINISKALNGTYRYNYYLCNGESFTFESKGFNTNGAEAFTGDFNGDGKHDVLVKSNSKVFDGDGREIASGGISDWGSEYITDYYPNCRYLCDMNGNGKTDLLIINSSGAKIFELNGSSFVELPEFRTADIPNYYFPYFGDFNGDGKTDVLIQRYDGITFDNISILFSTGKGFVKQAVTNADTQAKVFTGDFNKDGKTDIFHMEIVNNNTTLRMKVGTYNGIGFTTSYHTPYYLTPQNIYLGSGSGEYDNYLFQVADFDGDGRSDFCCARYIDTYIIHSFTDNQTLLAQSITNGLGASTSFQYEPITDNVICPVPATNTAFPVVSSRFPLYVVSAMTQAAGSFNDYTTYRYKNPRIHKQGKGFLGFEEMEVSNYNTDRKVVSTYGFNSSYFYPYLTAQKVTTRSGSSISTSVYENAFVYNGAKRVIPYMRKTTSTDHLTGVVKTVECTQIDSWGNPLVVVNTYGNDVTETVTSTYLNSETDNRWIIGLPQSVEKKTTKSSGTWTEKQTFTYHTNYSPQQIIHYTNNGAQKTAEETFGYDSYGNITSRSTQAYASSNVLTTTYAYAADGVFLTKTTDPLGLATTHTYNLYGLLASTKDAMNTTTTYEYDGMGRLKKTNYPDQTSTTTTLSWATPVANSVYCITQSGTGKPTVKTYSDAFTRELRSSVVRFDGIEMHTDKKYDSAGRIYQESLPFKGNAATAWNTYQYDSYGRISQFSSASGKITAYSYAGNRVTETNNGIASTKTFNAKGELVSVADPAGTITYTLRPDGQPSGIVAPGNITTSFVYDGYGRQTGIQDPSAGNRSFGYDAAGNLNYERDGNNRIKTMSYDAYGRIISKVLPEFTTSYGYNTYGLLSSESSTNGTSHTYQYDSYGRLSNERDNGPDSKWLEKVYSYSAGNLASVQFTSQSGAIGTEAYTYANGHLSEIKSGSSSIWKLNAENATGIPTSVVTGTVTRTYGYNAYGIPTGRSAYSSNGGTFQNATYSFDATKGNLTYRKDNNRNRQENFEYDNLNRLKTYAGISVGYDLKGNITSKADVGSTFYYNTANKPYAISGVDAGTNSAIPARNQSVTYTSFERPATLSENGYVATFTYDGSGNRKKMQLSNNGSNQLLRYYLGDRYELDQGTSMKQKLYLGGDAYSAPAVYVNQGSGWVLYYICRDYLGSITHVVNSNGTVAQETSYDAWGRLRNPADQVVYSPDNEPALFLGRGYTGHEHLTMFGLIHMNARLYDPAIGRFLSPDPYVQAPDFSQNFNRYAYAMNNPLKYTDPDGEWIHIVIGAVIGGAINLGIKAYQGKINSWGDGFAAFGIGAVAGAIGAATGGAAFVAAGGAAGGAGGFLAGAAGGAIGTAFSSPILSMGNSAYFGDPMMTGKQYLMGIAGGALLGGTVNGITALANGRNFMTGNLSAPATPTVTPTPAPTQQSNPNNQQTQQPQQSTLPNQNNNSFTVTTTERSSQMLSLEGQGIRIETPRPQIQGYNQSIIGKTDLSHRFPFSFDEIIVKGGDFSFTSKGNYWYVAPGSVNSGNGWFSIGMHPNGTIFHRSFSTYYPFAQ